jgi:hypothetical protein
VLYQLSYTRFVTDSRPINSSTDRKTTPILQYLVEGEGFEPSKAEPSDLQSDPFDRSGTPPTKPLIMADCLISVNDNCSFCYLPATGK